MKRVPAVNDCGELAMVRLSPLGVAVSAELIALPDFELKHKDEVKGYTSPIPHNTKR